MGQPGAACDRCGKPLALHQAWILIQDDETSTLCEPCALDVGPTLTGEPGTPLLPPPPRPARPAADVVSPANVGDDDDGWAGRHPVVWVFGSMLLLALALAPVVFFYWLASR